MKHENKSILCLIGKTKNPHPVFTLIYF